MPLSAGARLGPYEIVGPLGSGGMGEVYRARDTRLDRTVAIKVLPAHVAADPAARERFEREAHVISSLDHPHICALYDVGPDFLVMPCLEGETLADRVARGPMPLDELLRYGIEIASALDAAHRASVVHRDLKPGNVMLTPTGARLLDFGLAKSGVAAIAGSGSVERTVEQPLTAQGTILGTFQYMSPEQVEGREADSRTDIFSLGCVLYEMATGRRAFTGTTPASLIGAILHVDPPSISSIRAQSADSRAADDLGAASIAGSRPVPAAFERLVKKCLAKDPAKRWQSAADLADELRWIAEGYASADTTDAPRREVVTSAHRPRRRERLAWAAAALFALLAAAIGSWTLVRPQTSAIVMRSAIPVEAAHVDLGPHTIAISPQGTHIAYVTPVSGGRPQLYVRRLDQPEGTLLHGTEDAVQPFFSPDGNWVGFFARSSIKKVAITGGAPLTIADGVIQARGAAWGPNDTVVFAGGPTKGLSRVSARGGAAEDITTLDANVRGHRWPTFLPNGQVLFSVTPLGLSVDGSRVAVLSLDTKAVRTVYERGNYPRYSPSGHLLVVRAGILLALRFDLDSLTVDGGPVAVIDNVAMSNTNGAAQFAVADTGTLVYQVGQRSVIDRLLVLADRQGKTTPILPARPFANVRHAPDGRRIALTIQQSPQEMSIYDLNRKTTTRFPGEAMRAYASTVWTPDGKRIIYGASIGTPSSVTNLAWRAADGSGQEEILLRSDRPHVPTDVSPDGAFLAFIELNSKFGGADVMILPLTGEGRKPRPFVQTQAFEEGGVFSPDGKWLAYVSNASGQAEVYVEPFPGPGGKIQVSTNGGNKPRWTAEGRELIFGSGNAVMAVPITLSPSISLGTPVRLFEGSFSTWDVSSDGKQFVLVQQPADAASRTASPIHLVANWFDELRQKVPSQ
jgi:serine/threonine protein kinase/Tol biopolymer transport system component